MITATSQENQTQLANAFETVPPTILYVATTRHYGGLEVASIRLADLLMRSRPDRQRIVFACRPGKYVEQHCREIGIPTAALTVRNSGDLAGVDELVRIALEHKADIIHVHSRRDYVVSVLAKAKLAKMVGRDNAPKLVLHMHLLRPLGSPSFLSGFFFAPNVDRFLAVSGAVRDYLLRSHKQIAPGRISVVSNSVDPDSFRLDPIQGQAIRRKYCVPADAVVVGMVGRLDTKGQVEAIQAIGYLNRPNVYLLIVGATNKRGYLWRLRLRARLLGVSRNVIFCGAQQDVASYLSAMDIFVHLPRDEAFGLAPAEAMSAGLPVLVSSVGGCVELVADSETGLMANPRDKAQIRAKLAALIDSAELRERLATAGSEYVRNRFTPQAQAEALMNLYDEVLEIGHGK
jgi:glycosyltransferase involved in cell wall biosynthesis